jgi:molecular chaperone GrpE
MSSPEETGNGPVVRDLRRIDPATGQVRDPGRAATAQQGGAPRSGKGSRPGRHAASKPGGTSSGAPAGGNGPSGNGPSGQPPAGSPAPDGTRQGGTSQGGASQGAAAGEAASGAGSTAPGDGAPAGGTPPPGATGPGGPGSTGPDPQAAGEDAAGDASGLAQRLAERTADLQRIGAEYANYRKRVERDRIAVREQALANVLQTLLPVLDDIGRAREHGELVGGFKSVADSLETVVSKLGLASFGSAGEPFDPTVHEALMHSYSAEVSEPTAVQILQPGYKVGERILRPARVAVAEPETPAGGARQGTGGEPGEAASGTTAGGKSRAAPDGQPPGAAGARESSEEDD